MLARPQFGTMAHMMLWVASQPANKTFYWSNARECACGQYAREHGYTYQEFRDMAFKVHDRMNTVAYHLVMRKKAINLTGTYGELIIALHDMPPRVGWEEYHGTRHLSGLTDDVEVRKRRRTKTRVLTVQRMVPGRAKAAVR